MLFKNIKRDYIFFVLIFIPLISSCQNKFNLLDIEKIEINKSVCRTCEEFTGVSFMAGLQNDRIINDTPFVIMTAFDLSELYVCNTITCQTHSIPLNSLPAALIRKLYYHNHDSIFIFFSENSLKEVEENSGLIIPFHFILLNGKGNIVNTYNLKDVPYSFQGQHSPLILLNGHYTRMPLIKNNCLLIFYDLYRPMADENYNPKLLCSYNLANKTYQMLNVNIPKQFLGNKYEPGCIPYLKYTWDKDTNLLISYGTSGDIYKYYFDLDTVKCIYTYNHLFFSNIDSLNRETGKEYMNVAFDEVKYCSETNQYIRRIRVRRYKNYKQMTFTELLDSNFQHIGYFYENERYQSAGVDYYGRLQVFDEKKGKQYLIKSFRLHTVSIEDFEKSCFRINPNIKTN